MYSYCQFQSANAIHTTTLLLLFLGHMKASDLSPLGFICVFLEDFRDVHFLIKDSLIVISTSNKMICAFKVHFHFHNRGLFWLLSFEYNMPETLCFHNTS